MRRRGLRFPGSAHSQISMPAVSVGAGIFRVAEEMVFDGGQRGGLEAAAEAEGFGFEDGDGFALGRFLRGGGGGARCGRRRRGFRVLLEGFGIGIGAEGEGEFFG